MKANKVLLLVILAALILVAGFLFWVNSGRIEERKEELPQSMIQREVYESIPAEDLGLTLIPRADKHALNLEITKLSGIQIIEYELSYLTKGDIPRGVIGTIEIKSSDKKISRELLLGTCSRDVCKWDEGITSVSLILKITKTDGKIFQSEKKLDL